MGRKAEITIEQAAQIMHKDPQYIRLGLQQKRFDFGDAVQKENGRWSYNIVPIKFYKYMGMESELQIHKLETGNLLDEELGGIKNEEN